MLYYYIILILLKLYRAGQKKEDVEMIFETLLTHPSFQRILNLIIDDQNNTYLSYHNGNIL